MLIVNFPKRCSRTPGKLDACVSPLLQAVLVSNVKAKILCTHYTITSRVKKTLIAVHYSSFTSCFGRGIEARAASCVDSFTFDERAM